MHERVMWCAGGKIIVLDRYSVMPPFLLPSGHAVAGLGGEIDLAAVYEVTVMLDDAIAAAGAGVILDLGEVTFIDASGLGVLVRAHHRSCRLPAGLRLAAVPSHAVRLLGITGLDHYLLVFPTVRAAVGGGFGQQTRGDYSASAGRPRETL